jgi:hypothetical protein
MSLPPVYEIFRKRGMRFVANAHDGKFTTNCPKCGRQNTNFVELDDDGEGFRCHCEGEGCGFSGFERLRPSLASGNGPSLRNKDDEKRRQEAQRRAIEEARKEFPDHDEPEQEGAPVPAQEPKREDEPEHEAPTIEEATVLRRALVAAGYVPIPLYGKEPPIYGKNNQRKGFTGWPDITSVTDEMIVMWAKTWSGAVNTGVLTRNVPTLDLDILNEEAVRACEDLVRERCEEAGYILVRVGNPPKRAILFSTEEPFDKIVANVIAPNESAQKIEFLCDGQQVVVAGIHPDTKQPYRWHGGEPWTIKREDLPYNREEEARALVNDLIELLIRDFGYKRAAERPSKSKPAGDGGDRGGGAEDWQYLLDNVHAGHELHDTLRDLAAKMIRAGTSAGATINLLRAHMEGSSAPHDERWRQRYDDISRLVESAEERFGAPEPQPKPPAQPKPQQPESQTSTIDEVIATFHRWLLLRDVTPLLALLGTVAANFLPGDPVWFGVVAPGSSAKTEMLNSVSQLPHIHKVGTLTLPALLSGTPKRQRDKTARGGLLREVGDFGIIVAKDFGSVLSMRPDAKAELLGALREVYDGEYTRRIGTEGGRQLYWKGKVGFVFGCTPVIDSHHSVIGAMGERFLLGRLAPEDGQFLHALKHAGAKTADMRQELVESVVKLFAKDLREPIPLGTDEALDINEVVSLVVALRGPIERDRHSREIENIYGKEGTGRLGLMLERLLGGLDGLGVERNRGLDVIKRVAMDSVPPIRRAAYECVYKYHDVVTADVAVDLRLPTGTCRRALEELAAYGLVERRKLSANKDQWIAIGAQGEPEPKPARPPEPGFVTENDDRTS